MNHDSQAHIFVVWQSGFEHLSQILWELSLEFEIKHAEKLTWEKEEIPQALTRMYPNRDFDLQSPKLKEIGGGELIYILVVDKHPEIRKEVNQRVLRQKKKHRTQELGHPIFRWRVKNINYLHASDLETEALFNFQALTNGTEEEFNQLKSGPTVMFVPTMKRRTLEIKKINKPAFSTIKDVFDLLNEHTSYAVLRNWEGWPEELISDAHADVDLLTEDYYKTLLLLGAKPIFPQSYRVHHLVNIGDRSIPFDVRFVGDGYYDNRWQESMLRSLVKSQDFFHLDKENHFWSLLYHGIFHKRGLSEEYKERLVQMNVAEPTRAALRGYLAKNKYSIPAPKDRSVKFHKSFGSKVWFWSKTVIRATTSLVKPARENLSVLARYENLAKDTHALSRAKRIKYGVYDIGNKIIKTTDPQRTFLLKHEGELLKQFAEHDEFPSLLDAFTHGGQHYLVLEKKPGKPLNQLRMNKKTREQFSRNLQDILSLLESKNVFHRDIRQSNLLVTKDGKVTLIDFQFAQQNNQPIKASNAVEKYILQGAEKNLGGKWYKHDGTDWDAAQRIIAYTQHPPTFIKQLRSWLRQFTA